MAQKNPLEGLIKWALREEWRELLEEVSDRHFAPACEEMGVEADDLQDLLDETDLATLWSCVFEDMIASEIDGRNVADDYLKRRGWKESAGTRALIKALRQSVVSLYEVGAVRREDGFFLRDLVRGGELVWVHEKSTSRDFDEGDRLAARLVSVNGRAQLGGTILSFARVTADLLQGELATMINASPRELAAMLAQSAEATGEDVDEELKEIIAALENTETQLTVDQTLARSALIFTTYWLRDRLDEGLDGDDDDAFDLNEIVYPLADRATPEKVRAAMAGIREFSLVDEYYWHWEEATADGNEFAGPAQDDGTTILGSVELAEAVLVLTVHFAEHFARGRQLIESALGNMLEPPIIRVDLDNVGDEDDEQHEDDDLPSAVPPERPMR